MLYLKHKDKRDITVLTTVYSDIKRKPKRIQEYSKNMRGIDYKNQAISWYKYKHKHTK